MDAITGVCTDECTGLGTAGQNCLSTASLAQLEHLPTTPAPFGTWHCSALDKVNMEVEQGGIGAECLSVKVILKDRKLCHWAVSIRSQLGFVSSNPATSTTDEKIRSQY